MASIERIEVSIVSGGWREYVFVSVRDSEGRTGIGEATLKEKHRSVAQAVLELGERMIGKDAGEIERFVQELYVDDHWRGGPVHNSALSGIETALWDLLGQAAGLPVWRLFGGRVRPAIRLYANGWFRQARDLPQLLEAASKTVALGYTALKWNPFLPAFKSGQSETPAKRLNALEKAAEIVFSVREAVGPEVDLLIECHGLLSKEEALFLITKVESARPLLVEEPVHPDDSHGMSWLCARSPLPIAAGERWFTRWDVLPVIGRLPLAILQTDLCHCGGMSELKKIAAAAEAAQIRIAPHNSAGPLATIANAQVMLTCPNFLIQEVFFKDIGWTERFLDTDAVIEKGMLRLSETPGLGARFNKEALTRHLLQTVST